MKFRKKPIVVEAELFHSQGNVPEGVQKRVDFILDCPVDIFYIQTLEGDMQVKNGDYVITGVNGEKYPCKPDIFEKTYEKVEE